MNYSNQLRSAQTHLASKDSKLAKIIRHYGSCTITPHQDYYSELISNIVGQQLSVKAGETIWRRVLEIFDNHPPTPQQLIKINSEILRNCGVSYAKISYMKDLAQHIIDGRLDLKQIANMSNNDLVVRLTAVKGIGPWSAHMFMIFSLGRLDILPVGDLGIKKAAMKIYALEQLPDPQQLNNLAQENNWNPYESVASWYLWRSLDNSYFDTA